MSNIQTAFVGESEPGITYGGHWFSIHVTGASLHTSYCDVPASFSFQFVGTQVAVLGSLQVPNGTDPLVSAYTVDESKAATYTAPTNTTEDQNLVPFFISDPLTSGPHTLSVNIVSCSLNNPYIFLGIAYRSVTQLPSAASTNLPVPTSIFQSPPTGSESHSTPVGAIVGGVVGGVAVLIASAIAVWFLYFRHRHTQPYLYKATDANDLLAQEVKPYDTPGPQSPPSTIVDTPSQGLVSYYTPTSAGSNSSPPASEAGLSSYAPSGSASALTRQSHAPSTTLSIMNPGPPIHASPNQEQSKAAQAGLLSVPQQATYHADSGIRFEPSPSGEASGSGVEEVPADVPPIYSEK